MSGRKAEVADLPGQHPAEVLTVVETLDLPLGRLVDVDPSLSKNRRTTDWGSSGRVGRSRPAVLADEVTWNRVTGTVAASRSSTLTPAALQPTMIARLRTRAARLVSRELVTVAPFSRSRPRPSRGARPAPG